MHKDGKWARAIIALQEDDGKWGCFHSLSQFYNSPVTTEQALCRLERLGYFYFADAVLPDCFESREASRYLGAIELLSKYKSAKDELKFVADWLIGKRNLNGKWDLGKTVNDKVYFPLSNDWRKKEMREADCTERIEALLKELL